MISVTDFSQSKDFTFVTKAMAASMIPVADTMENRIKKERLVIVFMAVFLSYLCKLFSKVCENRSPFFLF